MVVFFDYLEPALLRIAALLLLAFDFLLYPPNFDFTADLPAFETLVLAKEVLLILDDLDFPVFLVFYSSSLPSSAASSSSSSQPGSMSIKRSTASNS